MDMNYEMEELVPIVARLTKKMIRFESTSITYEKAEQLMGAVIYCINELDLSKEGSSILTKNLSAKEAYEMGYVRLIEKVKQAMIKYNTIIVEFDFYENRCLNDTFIKGIPEFFKWYDAEFEPQNTILNLDYPVLKDISMYSGIDAVFIYIECIRMEQKFLSKFSKVYIKDVLSDYSNDYKNMIENICQIVFVNALGHILVGKSLDEKKFTNHEHEQIKKIFFQLNPKDTNIVLENITKTLVEQYYDNDRKVLEYLQLSINDISVRLKKAIRYDTLGQLF